MFRPSLKVLAAPAIALLLPACGPPPALEVKHFKVNGIEREYAGEPMVRNERYRRLHGAVSMAEMSDRLGSYYSVLWNNPAGPGEVEVVFEYQQGATASKVKRATRRFPATDSSGLAEFSIIGRDYAKNGRVLAWKTTLLRGKRVIATRHSYLWRDPPPATPRPASAPAPAANSMDSSESQVKGATQR